MLRFATSPCVLPAGERFGNRCLRVTVPSKAERGPEQPEVNSVGRRLAFNDLCVHVQARSHSPRERCPSTMPYLALYGGASEVRRLIISVTVPPVYVQPGYVYDGWWCFPICQVQFQCPHHVPIEGQPLGKSTFMTFSDCARCKTLASYSPRNGSTR